MQKFLHPSSVSFANGESTIYDLYACVVHWGGTVNSGHYFTFAKHAYSKKWYRFNDEK